MLPASPSHVTVYLHPSCSRLPVHVSRFMSGDCGASKHRHSSAFALCPRDPRSGPGYSVPVHHRLSAPSVPLAGTSRFRCVTTYTRRLRCAGAPRRPARGSVLSLHVPCQHAVLHDPGALIRCIYPVPSRTTRPSTILKRLGTPNIPPSASSGPLFRSYPFAHCYGLLACLPPLADPTEPWLSRLRLLLPGFRRIGHPPRRRVSLRCQLGNLHRRVFHPLERQLASLHSGPERLGDDPPDSWLSLE